MLVKREYMTSVWFSLWQHNLLCIGFQISKASFFLLHLLIHCHDFRHKVLLNFLMELEIRLEYRVRMLSLMFCIVRILALFHLSFTAYVRSKKNPSQSFCKLSHYNVLTCFSHTALWGIILSVSKHLATNSIIEIKTSHLIRYRKWIQTKVLFVYVAQLWRKLCWNIQETLSVSNFGFYSCRNLGK